MPLETKSVVWHTVGPESRRDAGPTLVSVGGAKMIIVSSQGKWFAFDRHCPHVGGPMMKCEVSGAVVTCPLHGWSFDLDNEGGEIHGYRPLRVFPLRIDEAGNLLVSVPG